MSDGVPLDVLLTTLAETGSVGADATGYPVITTPDGREVLVLLSEVDWDQLSSGAVHSAASAVEEVRRLVAESSAQRAYLVAGQHAVWLSPYDPGRR